MRSVFCILWELVHIAVEGVPSSSWIKYSRDLFLRRWLIIIFFGIGFSKFCDDVDCASSVIVSECSVCSCSLFVIGVMTS